MSTREEQAEAAGADQTRRADEQIPATPPSRGAAVPSRLARLTSAADRLANYFLLLPVLLLPPYGTLLMVYAPLTKQEIRVLRRIGASHTVARRAQIATNCNGLGVVLTWGTIGLGGVALLNWVSEGPPHSQFSRVLVWLTLAAAIVGLPLLTITTSSARTRLFISASRCTRLIVLFGADPIGDISLRWFRNRMRKAPYRRRRIAGLAWALTRDQARLTGRSATEPGFGEVLLWYAESPLEAKRRAILSGYIVDVITALSASEAAPDVQFLPAKRFATHSPRARFPRQLRSLFTAALSTGIIVAIVTALLKLVIK